MKHILFLTLTLSFFGSASFAQSPGFYLYDDDTNSDVQKIEPGDTLNLTDLYENPAYNIRYIPDPGDPSKPLYSMSYKRARYFLGMDKEEKTYTASGSNYYYEQQTTYSYLGKHEEELRSGADFDTLFIGGDLMEGEYELWYGYGEGFGSIEYVDSTNFYLFWDGGAGASAYSLLDPISQDTIIEIKDGDTLSNYIGNLGALLMAKYAGPEVLQQLELQIETDDLNTFPDTLSYLLAGAYVHTTDKFKDQPTFMLPGYGGSGRYFIRNERSLADKGIYVYLPRATGTYVDQDTVTNIVYEDSTVYNYVPKDSVVYNYIPTDSIVYNYEFIDSLVLNLIFKDSTVYNITSIDSIQIAYLDSIVVNILYEDSTIYTFIPKDSILYTFIEKDSTVWNYVQEDSTIYNYIPKDSIIWNYTYLDSIVTNIVYSDSVVYDTATLDTYTELILPVLLNELSQISGDAENLRTLLIKIRDDGLRSKEIYPQNE